MASGQEKSESKDSRKEVEQFYRTVLAQAYKDFCKKEQEIEVALWVGSEGFNHACKWSKTESSKALNLFVDLSKYDNITRRQMLSKSIESSLGWNSKMGRVEDEVEWLKVLLLND